MPAGKFLVGDFATGCGLADRMTAIAELSTEHLSEICSQSDVKSAWRWRFTSRGLSWRARSPRVRWRPRRNRRRGKKAVPRVLFWLSLCGFRR